MPNAQGINSNSRNDVLTTRPVACWLLTYERATIDTQWKPFDIHERLLDFACEIVAAAQFLHTQGGIARAFSYQLLSAGTSTGANAEESDGASSHDDFIAKNRIALKEAKESRFRLRVCRRCDFLDARYDPLVQESDELVRILGKIVHNALRNKANRRRRRSGKSEPDAEPDPNPEPFEH